MTSLKRTTSTDTDFQHLVLMLDAELAERDVSEHFFYAQYNSIGPLKNVVVCYSNNKAVGCGAFKDYEDGSVEIKRMYVMPEFRGKEIASAVLQELEKWAAELNYNSCVLETGKRQPEAIRFYQKSGYTYIPNYGQYEGVENSVCMEKKL